MTLPVFPTLPGQGWSVHKKPVFSTRVASHSSGREVRGALYAFPLWEFELVFEALDSASRFAGLQAQSLQTLLGFFLAAGGQLNTFLYNDPTDGAVTAQAFATGDGGSTNFTLARSLGGYLEPVSYATAVTAVTVAGSPVTGWTLAAPNVLTLASAPAAGATVAWTGTYAFACRFLDDSLDLEEFMSGLWSAQSVKFRSVRPTNAANSAVTLTLDLNTAGYWMIG